MRILLLFIVVMMFSPVFAIDPLVEKRIRAEPRF